jgi:hypothetical protein
MSLEVVSQLSPCQNHCVEQLLDLWVAGFGLGKHFADEVDWPLDKQCMPFFSSLDYDRDADHLSGRDDVDQEGFSCSGGHQDGCICKERLKVSKGFLGLRGPSEALGLP